MPLCPKPIFAMNENVFKFPDGNGGWIFKIQDEDGEWLLCDEEGNVAQKTEPVSSKTPDDSAPRSQASAVPTVKRGRKKKTQIQEEGGPAGLNVHFHPTMELLRRLNMYIGWKLTYGAISLSKNEVLCQALREFLDNDRDFQRHLRNLERAEKASK